MAGERTVIAGLKPHARVKDSGVPSIGFVPEHWEIRRLRQTLLPVTKRNRPDLPLLSVVREKGVVVRDLSNAEENHNYVPDDLSNYKVVRPGQFAMNKMKAWQGSYGVSRFEGIVSPAYFVFDLAGVGGEFFHHAIRSKAYVPLFAQASDGVRIGQWDLSQTRLREIPFAVPPSSEQSAIIRFLDHADRRFRKYIRAQQQLIKLLEEQKQAIIHRAVTRGLDPNVRLKPSGVEWLGELPEHWKIGRAANVCQLISAKAHEQFVEPDGEHICVTARFVSTDGRSFRRCTRNLSPAQPGDTLMVMSDLPRGRALARSYFVQDDRSYAVNQRVCILRPTGIHPHFLAFVSNRHPELLEHDDGFNQTHLPNAAFKTMRLPQPPAAEQARIVDFLVGVTQAIDASIDHASRELPLLNEYRSRLIADIVTGKLDIREAAGRLHESPTNLELLDQHDLEPDSDDCIDDSDAAT